MQIKFYKYHGTGNDFIMIDNRNNQFPKNDTKLVAHLCHRKFGIGADGLILLENDNSTDFKMVYYNSDGNTSTMCGNGGRCIVAFAKDLGILNNQSDTRFIAADGLHIAQLGSDGTVTLQMQDVRDIQVKSDYIFLDTGSPHHVQASEKLAEVDVKKAGSLIRYGDLYGKEGSNVNFYKQIDHDSFAIRTYERGVEDETLSCGTGATAVAIAMHATGKTDSNSVNINVEGGKLEISFEKEGDIYKNVMLKGPAKFVFSGEISTEML